MHSINNNFILSINNIKSKQYNRSSLQVWAVCVLGLEALTVSCSRLVQDRLSTFCPPYTAHHLFQKTNAQHYENCKSQKTNFKSIYTCLWSHSNEWSSIVFDRYGDSEAKRQMAEERTSLYFTCTRTTTMNESVAWMNESINQVTPASTAIPTTVLNPSTIRTNEQSCKYCAPCHMIGTFGNDFWRALSTCQNCQLRWFTNWLVRSASPRFTYLERLRLYYKSN